MRTVQPLCPRILKGKGKVEWVAEGRYAPVKERGSLEVDDWTT